jgi:hypothetical protein
MVSTELSAMAPHADPSSWVAPYTERFPETAIVYGIKGWHEQQVQKEYKKT